MPQLTLIAPATAAVTTEVGFETNGYANVTLSASGLATTEEVDIKINSGGTWKNHADGSGVIVLTATKPSVTLPAGPRYGVLKDATAGNCGVYVDLSAEIA